jgi:hypothetical protein
LKVSAEVGSGSSSSSSSSKFPGAGRGAAISSSTGSTICEATTSCTGSTVTDPAVSCTGGRISEPIYLLGDSHCLPGQHLVPAVVSDLVSLRTAHGCEFACSRRAALIRGPAATHVAALIKDPFSLPLQHLMVMTHITIRF